jgi:hypothetical protein
MEYESDKSLQEDDEKSPREGEEPEEQDALTVATTALDSIMGDGKSPSPEEQMA